MHSGIGIARRRFGPAVATPTRRRESPSPLAWYVAAGLLAVTTAVAAILVPDGLKIAIAVPICLLATIAAIRLPAAVSLVILALTGIAGTIVAFTDVSPRYLIDLPLAGVVGATLWLRWQDRGHALAGPLPLGLILVLAYLAVSVGQALLSPGLYTAESAFRSSAWQMAVIPAIALAGWPLATRLRIVQGYLVLVCIVAGYALVRLAIGPAGAEREVALAMAPENVLPSGEVGLYGSMISRHQLAAWCGMALPFATAVAIVWGGGRRSLPLAAVALSAVALIATQTRGGFAGAVVGITVVLALYAAGRAFRGPCLRKALLPLATVLGALAIGFAATSLASDPESAVATERYTALALPLEDTAFADRLENWGNIVDEMAGEPLGHGFGTADFAVDSSYLRVGYEQGPLMMILFGAAVVALGLALAAAALRTPDRAAAGILIACCGAYVAFAVDQAVSDTVEPALVAWMMAGLGLAGVASRAIPD